MAIVIGAWSALAATPAAGLLRVSKENPRYFTDGSGKAIYLPSSTPSSKARIAPSS